jgi:predicted signal transduction protein with EAL and GGDEF domain
MVVVLLDIDRFSFINETMGYDSGTELLRSVGNRLSRTFAHDGAREKAIIGRFGADGRDLFLKVAIGVSWFPEHGRDAKSVFRCAEAALHRSMRSLDTSIIYYHSEMRYRARHKFDLEAELRGAIESGQIVAHYQPQQCTCRCGSASPLDSTGWHCSPTLGFYSAHRRDGNFGHILRDHHASGL